MESHKPPGEAGPTASEVVHAIIRTAHHIRHEFEAGSSALGIPSYLTGPRLRVLGAVSEFGPIRMNDLAQKMGIRAITVTQFVDALEKEGLLVRLPDPTDRRATLLQLTETAPALLEKAREASRQVTEKMMEPLSMEMRSQLLDILSRIGDYKQVCLFDDKNVKSTEG
ncbi:MarR family winged helix-turn-helix transcriptional regulator [Paenibacillus sedimenti]|uniref:MarR family transcriptional regulator n=1 Tax=Paenibacillus sedimenti TaxID=2770274 RepID=A0A926KND6_9BACL|nr:MarR family transcriptional regulator [Paenibacillus sedimenti]MBD0379205.1 MarR family transcriptional regulator [Paenibacillus sedimenti]